MHLSLKKTYRALSIKLPFHFKSKTVQILYNHLITYPAPLNLNYWWGFGSLAGICLVLQIITGLLLAIHYVPDIVQAFDCVEHIMRDVKYGWLLRYAHANGASMFFIVVYLHMVRGLFFGSYEKPREKVWITGVIIYILMMGIAFLGYVLPWGQMSFWGATVITNFITVIPFSGTAIVHWVWGGFTINNATLIRFFVLHFLLPFLLIVFVLFHLYFLHKKGSNNPIGIQSVLNVTFYPYFYVKDLYGLMLFLVFYSFFVFYLPNFLGHFLNYVEADPLVTPNAIVPEWYFLVYYAILRCIEHKTTGVCAMFLAIVVLLFLPFYSNIKLHSKKIYLMHIRSSIFIKFKKFLFILFIYCWISLLILGHSHISEFTKNCSQFFAMYYFFYFLIIIPFFGLFNNISYVKRI